MIAAADTDSGQVRVRGDGIHYTDEGGRWAARWLAPQLRALALEAADRS